MYRRRVGSGGGRVPCQGEGAGAAPGGGLGVGRRSDPNPALLRVCGFGGSLIGRRLYCAVRFPVGGLPRDVATQAPLAPPTIRTTAVVWAYFRALGVLVCTSTYA